MQNLEAPVELDFKETNEEWEGKWLTEGAYDSIVHTKDYEYGVNIFSPASSFDPIPIATVIPNVYENRDHLVDTLNNINETSTMRANAAGPIDHEEMKSKGLIEGEHYKLRTPNSYYVRTKSGGWGMIAYANEIHSVMIGYKRGRFTGGIDASGWTKDHPEEFDTLKNISKYNEIAFEKANPAVYKKQKIFAETSIKPEHRIGIFTTLSANRYHAGQSTKMAAHVDSGDTEFGMTTMCVFREGDYTGAYLTFPRYGVAIDAPDNSVVIADSRQVHGVTEIHGAGQRFSCVAYCDNRLATKGVAGKSERLIGKYAKSGSLEQFI